MSDSIDRAVRDIVRELSGKPAADLAGFPQLSEEERVIDGKRISFSVWHDLVAPADHRIVVQAQKRGWFGLWTSVWVDGFVKTMNNDKRPLTMAEWAIFA